MNAELITLILFSSINTSKNVFKFQFKYLVLNIVVFFSQ